MATLLPPDPFRVESRSETTTFLSWTNKSVGHAATLIERAKEDGSFSQIASLDPTDTAFSDTGLEAGTRYRYRARTTD